MTRISCSSFIGLSITWYIAYIIIKIEEARSNIKPQVENFIRLTAGDSHFSDYRDIDTNLLSLLSPSTSAVAYI